MLLKRGAVDAFLSRDLESFLWMKKLTRERMMRDLNELRVPPKFKTEPWLHQLVCFYIGLVHPRFLFLLDMGAGKTKIICDLITHLLRTGKLDKALVTVPRLINLPSWREDIERHSDLDYSIVNVEDIEEKWERLITTRAELSVIDLSGLQWALCKREKHKGKTRLVRDDKKVKELLKRYNFLAPDEIHKLTSHDNLRFGYMNQLSKGMDFMYGTTGTLFGKNVEDLWSPFYLIDRGATFGENLGPFRAAFFDVKMNPWKGAVYTFRKDMEQTLHDMLQHRSIRYEESEMHDLPRSIPRKINLHMGDEQREHYLRALEGLINANGDLREMDAQWIRMRQIVSGYLAWRDANGDHVLHFKDNPKLDALEALVDEAGNNKVGIVYWYTETGRMIVERLRKAGYGVEWLYGGTKDHEALRDRFMKDAKSQVLVMQADTGGTGLDGLQKCSHYVFMYETPTDPITRKQVEKRWTRPGQTRRVFVYDFIMARSLDTGILEDIQEGINTHDAVVNGRQRGRGFFLGGD